MGQSGKIVFGIEYEEGLEWVDDSHESNEEDMWQIDFPICLCHVGHDDFNHYIIGVNESLQDSGDWSASELNIDELHRIASNKTHWVNELKKYCEKYGLKFKEPKWYLYTFYG